MGLGMGLNLLLLLAMVSTNILSLYHLSSSIQAGKPTTPPPVPDHLLHQLTTIRATINHLRSTATPATTTATATTTAPSDLLLYSHISPIGSACHRHPDLLHRYMNYTPYSLCPSDLPLAESLLLRGCHPLPRRRCFSPSPSSSQLRPNDLKALSSSSSNNFFSFTSELDLTIPQLLQIAKSSSSLLRLALDIGAGSGTFAAQVKPYNVTVLSTTMNLGFPFNEAAAMRGVVPLHIPLQQRLPILDGVVDLVRCGHAVNRWIPVVELEFLLYDVDRVLRGGGYLWLDRFFSKGVDLEKTYAPLIGKLGYKRVKWATATKTDSNGLNKNGEVYLTALLQKPLIRPPKS
ncbi:hypothetical protein Syun_028535 [Stephania yunnanensis]|uniref:Methyltransferase type 11 domain-containing protein n=1 Tax=Stephania yunnanensis TaxID=152371 RepID=A0AAP0ERG9_9MAGN